ncbi:ABC transporter substrate-binding protein [Neobacillus cucumis]|uniref:ABC transporter substrate-binding protein n=1 Tax=Neobacillus cucumis TaxID=1740721 RepID=UPI0028533548|nr:ABC transporter substrate-binding protein [Neobacillus cucumis]MDR4946742.1 ABC transporter substrate-binding protein [Neobacillus cucumis]
MQTHKRLISMILVCFLILLSACSSNKKSSTNESSGAGGNIPEVNMVFFTTTVPKDLNLVQDEINKITKKKINAKVKLTPINIGNYVQQTNLMLSSNEKADLMLVTSFFGYTSQVAKGQLLPLDDLVDKYGQDIKKVMDPDYLNAAKVSGKMYAIPTLRDMAGASGINMRKDLVDKYHIDISKIKTLDDVESMLKTIKKNEPSITPIVPFQAGAQPTVVYNWFDPLGDTLGVLPNYDNNLKVVDLYETKDYAQFVEKMRKWHDEGLTLKNPTTNTEAGTNLVKSNVGFSYFSPQKPGIALQESQITTVPMVTTSLKEPVTTTSAVTTMMWGIPQGSKVPEASMKFLNLMYQDKDIVNLLDWGIEGKHYVKVSDNVIKYPDGVDAQNDGYNLNMSFAMGDSFLSYVFEGNDPNLWTQTEEFNKSALKSKALGFNFDSSPVKTEVTAVTNVVSKYALGLESGVLDPKTKLPEFISSLKAAGIEKIIKEKQKQLNEWAKNQNK